MMRRIGQAKAELAADYAAQLARSAGKVVFFAKHIDVMDAAEETFARQGVALLVDPRRPDAHGAADEHRRLRQRPRRRGRGLLADRGRRGPQPAGRLERRARRAVLDRRGADPGHRPQSTASARTEPVTAWRIIAAQTIDARIAELIDSKAGLAARALDGSDEEVSSSADVQLEALVALLTDALRDSAEHVDVVL